MGQNTRKRTGGGHAARVPKAQKLSKATNAKEEWKAAMSEVAGPQLNTHEPPWHRPAHALIKNTHPPWPGWGANESIPLHVENTPGNTENQFLVNGFLQALQDYWKEQPNGPSITEREISSNSDKSKKIQLYVNGVTMSSGKGSLPMHQTHAVKTGEEGDELMKLGKYSATASTFRSKLSVKWGKFALVNSRESITERNRDEDGNRVQYWHNCAVLWYQKKLFIYDPSFVHENVPEGKVRGRATEDWEAKGSVCSTRMVGLSTVWAICRHMRALKPRREGEKRTYQEAVAETEEKSMHRVWIGGGGNVEGLEECRKMSCNFIQQAAWLVQRINVATAKEKKQREWEFTDFVGDFVALYS